MELRKSQPQMVIKPIQTRTSRSYNFNEVSAVNHRKTDPEVSEIGQVDGIPVETAGHRSC